MRYKLILLIIGLLMPIGNLYAGGLSNPTLFLSETDSAHSELAAVFDLRDRETLLQLTNINDSSATLHIQIYNVANLCNENDFFDEYTPNDTHIYDLRNILTNDGNPSGVVLPDDAYGIVFITQVPDGPLGIFGNIRMIDSSGYEYRTNVQSVFISLQPQIINQVGTFNYNSESGIILSDVFGVAVSIDFEISQPEATIDNVLSTFVAVDVDIVDNNEVLFSCRDVIFSCVDEDNPLQEELISLAEGSSASVARFEYGINNSIPNSKDGELLCPGNNISEGTVLLRPESVGDSTQNILVYVGLNNGNGRGTMDAVFGRSVVIPSIPPRG